MSNLAQRLLTAALAVPLLIAAIRWENAIAVQLIVLLATLIGLHEWMRMTLPQAAPADRGFGIVVGLALAILVLFAGEQPMVPTAGAAFAVIAAFVWFLFRYGTIDQAATRIACTVCGWLYVLLVLFLALLKVLPGGGAWVFIAVTVAWGSDACAYFAGRLLGSRFPRALYPAVSPRKTVVGAIGGLTGAWLCLLIAKLFYAERWGLTLSWLDTVLIAVPANVLGQLGDLTESLIKRSVGVKDSGALLPGHGGMLDRIDALNFVAPCVYVYARWVAGR